MKVIVGPAAVRPLDVASRLSPVAAVLIWIPPKLARPAAFVDAVAPASIVPDEGCSVMLTPAPGTLFVNWSSTCTVTAGLIATPATTFEGFWTKASFVAAAGVTSKELEFGLEVSPLADATNVMPVAAVLILIALNVATPEAVFAVRARGDRRQRRRQRDRATGVTGRRSCRTRPEPRPSPAGVIVTPATTFDGPCEKINLAAAPGVTLNDVDGPLVSAGVVDDAVRVRPVATVLNLRALKVARPVTPVAAVLPDAGVCADASVTDTPLLETALPNWSCTCTVTGDIATPAATFDGCATKPSLLAAAAETTNDDEAELVRLGPVDVAVIVSPAFEALIVIPPNVANPAALVVEEFPETIALFEPVRVTVRPLVATGLPKESCTCTLTAGVIARPAVTFDGCCTKPSLLAAPAVTLKALEAAEVTAPDVAVRVRPVAAVLIVIPLKVANPEAFVAAVAPPLIVPEDGESVMDAALIGLLNASFAVTVTEATSPARSDIRRLGAEGQVVDRAGSDVERRGRRRVRQTRRGADEREPGGRGVDRDPVECRDTAGCVFAVAPALIVPADGVNVTSGRSQWSRSC